MNFDLLRQSIELNAEESPSVYNALNMIRALFQDVEDAANAPLSLCPVGDEKLPLEMIWLSKELLSIYEDNADSLQRNRARLDNIMGQLRAAQADLEKLSEAAALLPEKEAQHQNLVRQLEAAKAARFDYDEVLRKTEAARKELDGLQCFDFDAAQLQLTDLQEQIRTLEDRIRTLDTEIQKQHEEKEKLQSDQNAHREHLDLLQTDLKRLTTERDSMQTQIRDITEEITCLQSAAEAARAEQDRLNKLIGEARLLRQDLEAQVSELTEEKNGLDTDTARLNDLITQLSNGITDLRRELTQTLQPEHQHLAQLKLDLEEEKRRTRQELDDLVKQTNAMNAELVLLRQDLPLRMQERDAARQRVADYRRDMLDPVITERDALLETEVQFQADKAAAEKQVDELTEKQQKLVLEISRRKEQYHLDNNEYQNKLEREKKLIAEHEELTRHLRKATSDLALRQDEYDELHDKTLPDAEKFLAAETKRRDDLQAQIDAINQECQENIRQINELDALLPGRQEELRKLQSRYNALTITYTTNNQDILAMERQIRELEAKNDKDRLDEYRTQLQCKQQELEDLAQSCRKLDDQIQELDRNLKAKNEDCRTLEDLKRKKDEGMKGIEQTLAELKPCSAPEYRRKAESINAQFHTLLTIRNNLANSICIARRTITGYEPASNETYILNLDEYLTKATAHSLDVYQQLVSCANTLKNHIMEEPK